MTNLQMRRMLALMREPPVLVSVDTGSLERDFLFFSSHLERKVLRTSKRKKHVLAKEEVLHYGAVLKKLGISAPPPLTIDMTGVSQKVPLDRYIAILSHTQFESDHYSEIRESLTNLAGEVFSKGAFLINNFTLQEALFGKIEFKRGELSLEEINVFPERFESGPYTLEVELDTPEQTVSRYAMLMNRLDLLLTASSEEDLKKQVLDQSFLFSVQEEAIALRKKIGSLSRYAESQNRFSVTQDNCRLYISDTECFFLYSEKNDANVLVYFGDKPFDSPRYLEILDGNAHEKTIRRLVELGFYVPSKDVLDSRLESFQSIYDISARAEKKSLGSERPVFTEVLNDLLAVRKSLNGSLSDEYIKKTVLNARSEYLEFMIYPSQSSIILHQLLPRLSWSEAIRNYNDSKHFISVLESSDPAGQEQMVGEVVANLMFEHQQNYDVNNWLYAHHKELCESKGVVFQEEV